MSNRYQTKTFETLLDAVKFIALIENDYEEINLNISEIYKDIKIYFVEFRFHK